MKLGLCSNFSTFMQKTVQVCLLMIMATSSAVVAQNKVVVIPLGGADGQKFERTIFVNGGGSAAANGAALAAAVTEAGQKAFGLDPWLIKLEPGIYNVTNAPLTIFNGVHLQGSGAENTIITWSNDFSDEQGPIIIDSDSSSVSDLAFEGTDLLSAIGILTNSSVTFRDISYTGVARGLVIGVTAACTNGGPSDVRILGSVFRVTRPNVGETDNDLINASTNCNVSIESSQFFGDENDDGLFIGSGNFNIYNSFIEDVTMAVGGSANATCRAISTSTGFHTTTCP